jgi:hypothetical protein
MPDLEVKAISSRVVHIVANSEPAVALLRLLPRRYADSRSGWPSVHRARARATVAAVGPLSLLARLLSGFDK